MSADNRSRASNPSEGEQSLRERVRRVARQVESEIILETLERHGWNRRQAARELRISYRSMMYKMKALDLRSRMPAKKAE
ncbi:MAG: hypothetical protein FJW37_14740 [Acidobacteria bacterium]|nr:hypothetical protein [Acidobacteriota bacterium]